MIDNILIIEEYQIAFFAMGEKGLKKMKTSSLFVTNRIVDNGAYLIYFAHMLHSMFRIDKVTGEIELEAYLATNDYFRSFLIDGDKYLLFPEGVGKIGMIDSYRDCVQYMEIPPGLHLLGENNWSSNYVRYMDDIFFYWQSPVITKYNIINKRWHAYRDWHEELPDNFFTEHWMSEEAFLHEGRLYFPIGTSKYLVEVTPVSGETHICTVKVPVDVGEVELVRYEKGVVWVLCRNMNDKIFILRSNSFLLEPFEVIAQISVESGKGKTFSLIAVGKEYLWLFPGNYDQPYVIHMQSGQTEISDMIPAISMRELKTKDISYNYIYGMCNGRLFWTMNIHTGDLVQVDLLQDEIHIIRMFASPQIYVDLLSGFFASGIPVNEGPIELIEFLHIVKGGTEKFDGRNNTMPDIFSRRNFSGGGNHGYFGFEQDRGNQKRTPQKYYVPEYFEKVENSRDARKWNCLFL